MRIAYLTNIPGPYRAAMIEAWATRLARDGITLSVSYTDEGDQGRGWAAPPAAGISETRLPTILRIPGYGRLNRGLLDLVRRNDVVMIGGFEQASYLAAAVAARLAGRRVILLFDGFGPKRMTTDPILVHLVKKFTAKLCNAYFANGSVGRSFLVDHLGVDPGRVFNQYLCTPTGDLERERASATSRMERRRALGLPTERPIAVVCGYLIERKQPETIVDAVAGLAAERRPLLLFVGRGPLQDAVAERARRLGVDAVFAGFRQGRELAAHYLASDFLILSSRDDPWGLVVNEAMAAGLPVVCSDACGARLDLVEDGVTGFGFRAGDAGDLGRAIGDLLGSDMVAMGDAARHRIAEWTPERSAESLAACVRSLGPV